MLTARGVYLVHYPAFLEWTSRPQADQAIREVECVGLREERGMGLRDLRDWCLLIILTDQAAISL